ncbi:AraC family transcriptional regulator [Chroococcidiopsis sp. CCALA 051]|uniref:helix-turn-helix domain-containing protein n=1 Tax=Chroococcidiopsis sp. CCALA 051 TaxID=869949 RepID=UPI000D0DC22E|nr:AraC family transcriptional regulator [Chroococcidiopsis sp. CCALA 051]MBE9018266.1 helix-turn-helix transcriptional regulator [Chroococcidiopsidales cyanobacterium LEGE 13417]PSM50534.1 AraC family transcriptional regulator [Chroococcidiopsis sp. CCALA 051]
MPGLERSPTRIVQLNTDLYPPIYSSQAYGWKNILVEEFRYPPGQETYQNLTSHTLCVSLNRRPSRLSLTLGDRRHSGLFSQGDISITPAEAVLICQGNDEDRILRIQLASQFFQQVAQDTLKLDPDRVELLPEFRARNPQIEQISMMLLAELTTGGLAGKLYVESLTNVLAVHLLRNYVAVERNIALYDGGLSDRQLLKVTDYINAHLADDITLSDLAQLLSMSPFHFSRLFKRSIQVTPHQYVLQQRVEQAKQLLIQTELSIMDIALQCGFSSHSHLGKWFRQQTGVTPKMYRINFR